MRKTSFLPVCARFAMLGAVLARPAAAQNLEAQLKWTEAKVVQYRISGDYSGKMVVLSGALASRGASVTDHVEFEFTWDNQGMAMLGAPTIRSFPTKVVAVDGGPEGLGCPTPRILKPPEFATVTRVTAAANLLTVEFTTQTGEGSVPWIRNSSSSGCGDIWDPATSTSKTSTVQLQLLPAMMLAMGPAAGDIISKDGKSFTPKSEDGWTWVITPTIVR